MQTRAKAGHDAISDSCANCFKVVGFTWAVGARATEYGATDTDPVGGFSGG